MTRPARKHLSAGHYDLVIFNPAFLKECTYELAKGQNYPQLKHELPAILYRTQEHAILLGLEFMFNRTPLTSQKQAETWRDSVLQDYQKLHDSENWEYLPFMKEFRMLVFDGTGENGFSEVLNKAFQDLEGLDYITMNPAKK